MKTFVFAAVFATGVTTALLGLAAPAQASTPRIAPTVAPSPINIPADFGHHAWVIDIQADVNVPNR